MCNFDRLEEEERTLVRHLVLDEQLVVHVPDDDDALAALVVLLDHYPVDLALNQHDAGWDVLPAFLPPFHLLRVLLYQLPRPFDFLERPLARALVEGKILHLQSPVPAVSLDHELRRPLPQDNLRLPLEHVSLEEVVERRKLRVFSDGQRHDDLKGRAAPVGVAAAVDSPAHGAHDPLGDGEPEAGAPMVARVLGRQLGEGLEEKVLLILRNPFPIVPDLHAQERGAIRRLLEQLDSQHHLPALVLGELDGVVADVDEALADTETVAVEAGHAPPLVLRAELDSKVNLAEVDASRQDVAQLVAEVGEEEGLLRKLDARWQQVLAAAAALRPVRLRFKPRVLEHLVDNAQ
mmetsp:Transcript_50629/g.158177  ORF Transcript_50629/g.158177 Transcript_50629/m.158177 type:complete len:349 (+) Transcript_50629:765-1811(+)